MGDIYTLGQWKGKRQYKCKFCAFDTLDLPTMMRHYEDVHKPRPKSQPVTVPILNRFGVPITEREVVEVDAEDIVDAAGASGELPGDDWGKRGGSELGSS